MTFLEYAEAVLKEAKTPMSYQEIWKTGIAQGFDKKLNSKGQTPYQTLGALLFVNVRDDANSKFMKIGKRPARFFLKSRENELPEKTDDMETEESTPKPQKTKTKERDIHPLLAYFAYSNPAFNRGRAIYTKTIYHEKSSKKGLNEWLHPDMVGFYMPLEDWNKEVWALNKISDNNTIHFYSFELKLRIDRSNYREYFFQSVSNSSWAHEGYLVCTELAEDDDLMEELGRLSQAFGIGIIKLEVDDIDSSSVLYPAKVKESLEWETISKLSDQNPDFKEFIKDVKNNFNNEEIDSSKYDKTDLKDSKE